MTPTVQWNHIVVPFAADMGLNPAIYNFFEQAKTPMAKTEVDLEIGNVDGCIKETESSS